jgi:DNA-directed RNA polymerase delta subunit
MLQDSRFIYVGNEEWKLREFLTEEQIKNIDRNLYDITVESDNKVDAKAVDAEIEEEIEESEIDNEEEPSKESNSSDVEE